jgi:transposase InsO family protein
VRDRDAKFVPAFDAVFTGQGMRVVQTPVRAPTANAFAERWVGTVRRECLDWLLIASERHLRRVPRDFTDHYNAARPHRALRLQPPFGPPPGRAGSGDPVCRRDRLGGLIHEYERAAA